MRALWRRRWNVECCIANPWSSFASEEEMFESTGKNVDLFLCCAEAQGIHRTCLMSIAQDSAIRWGVSVEGQWLL